jgi:bacillaene synthase trans-acting acyltransferase
MDSKFKVVYLFSGQGSHYRGMGKKLYENNAVFNSSLIQSDSLVKKYLNRSLIDELYGEQQEEFDDLLMTHPAIVAIEIAMLEVLKQIGIKPDYVAGTSLGEFAAAVANEIWSHETAIEASIEQAKSIVRSDNRGGMLAILNQNREAFEKIYMPYQLYLASENFQGHFTLAGSVQNLNSFQDKLKSLKIEFVRLAVNYPFHSPLLKAAKDGFRYYSSYIEPLQTPKDGFISGISGNALKEIPENYFWNAVSCYSNFSRMVQYMEQKSPCLYIDLGPSGTSALFVKYNLHSNSQSVVYPIMSSYRNEEYQLSELKKILRL